MAEGKTWSKAALALWAILGDRPVAYHPELARALGNDINAALFLGQIMYWHNKGTWRPGWVAKSQEEIYNETALTRSQQERVRAKLRGLGVLSEKKMGVPARLYYRVHFGRLTKVLAAHMDTAILVDPDEEEPANKDAGNQQSEEEEPANKDAGNQQSISETTPQSTHESTPEESAGKPAQVLDEVFPESAALPKGKSKILEGDLEGMDPDEKAKMAGPGSGADDQKLGYTEQAWADVNRTVTFPFDLTTSDVYAYADLFSQLFDIPVPSMRTTITQWRRGIVDIMCAFADGLRQDHQPVTRQDLLRRARWCLQYFSERRADGKDWTFNLVSPLSVAKTMRVMAGELHKIQAYHDLGVLLPDKDMADKFYDQKNRAMTGAEMTEMSQARIEQMLLQVPA